MLGWPGPVAHLCFPVSAQGVSGSVAIEPCLGQLAFQLLERRIRGRFGNIGRPEHPTQGHISFGSQPVLGKQGIAFYAVQAESSLYNRALIGGLNRPIHFITVTFRSLPRPHHRLDGRGHTRDAAPRTSAASEVGGRLPGTAAGRERRRNSAVPSS